MESSALYRCPICNTQYECYCAEEEQEFDYGNESYVGDDPLTDLEV